MKLINPESLAICTVWSEARGEPYECKLGVAEVIRKRTERCYMSDGTLASTCLKDYQFSGWNNGDPNRIPSVKIDDLDPVVIECTRAWHESAHTHLAKGAVLFCNMNLAHPYWATPENFLCELGAMSFFKDDSCK